MNYRRENVVEMSAHKDIPFPINNRNKRGAFLQIISV